ncbi:MAG: rRNA maturation RNase YbeY [Xenococcaceae cyanobacterium MO_188.B32]|nr:rRNA maturation RNase YbeY [Xenococcaceae cyanobacterium MO_188.B32]
MESSIKKPISVEAYIENPDCEASLTNELTADYLSIPWSNWLQTWLEVLYDALPQADSYELSLKLVSDRQMQAINDRYRQQNKPTDVLAFAVLETDMPKPTEPNYLLEPLYLGDLVISLDTANKQAQTQGHSLTTEIAWLAAHGLLHLLGWDHSDEASLEEMLNWQTKLLNSISNIT